MNTPSSTIQASGITGALVAGSLIVLAIFAPQYYARLPPGSGETLVVIISTIVGYLKREEILDVRRRFY